MQPCLWWLKGEFLEDEFLQRYLTCLLSCRYDSYEEYQHERLKREEYRRDHEKREFERAEQRERQKQKAIVSHRPGNLTEGIHAKRDAEVSLLLFISKVFDT